MHPTHWYVVFRATSGWYRAEELFSWDGNRFDTPAAAIEAAELFRKSNGEAAGMFFDIVCGFDDGFDL